jgi:hypothetical protein
LTAHCFSRTRSRYLWLLAQQLIERDPDLQLLNPANLGIVCFRRHVDGLTEAETARANSWLIAALEATGRAMVSSTRLHGRFALRMCVLNHLTQEDDIRWTLDFLARTEIPTSVLESDGRPELWTMFHFCRCSARRVNASWPIGRSASISSRVDDRVPVGDRP